MLTVFPRIDVAGAPFLTSSTIYIRADGRVDPQGSPFSSPDNITYTLLTSIQSAIVVERDNIIVDGNGYTVQGVGGGYGIDLTRRINVTVKNIEIKAFFHGIYLWYSLNNSIIGNSITASTMSGIRLFRFSRYNTVSENDITNSANGIGLVDSSGNRIFGNSIKYNCVNIELYGSDSNVIYNNNFVINASQLQVHTFNLRHLWDIWDADYPSGGNYWSDYNDTDLSGGLYQNMTGSDGIGDSAFIIDAKNIDHYPLTGMFYSFNTYDCPVSIISNSFISNFIFSLFDSTHAKLIFHITRENGTQGFCRVCIPKTLINGSYVGILDGEIIAYSQFRELPCSDETYEYLYINYTQGEHTIEISGMTTLPEFSFIIVPLFMIITLMAVIVCRRKNCNPS
jgi:parallel beta-helix repeat protein